MADSELNRRDFIKVTTGIVGGLIGAALGVPAIAYLLDPAFKGGAKEGWVPIGNVAVMELGNPYPFSFTRTQVNGWERTPTSRGGFAIRQSEDLNDILILNSRCTHLPCTVNWNMDTRVGNPSVMKSSNTSGRTLCSAKALFQPHLLAFPVEGGLINP